FPHALHYALPISFLGCSYQWAPKLSQIRSEGLVEPLFRPSSTELKRPACAPVGAGPNTPCQNGRTTSGPPPRGYGYAESAQWGHRHRCTALILILSDLVVHGERTGNPGGGPEKWETSTRSRRPRRPPHWHE